MRQEPARYAGGVSHEFGPTPRFVDLQSAGCGRIVSRPRRPIAAAVRALVRPAGQHLAGCPTARSASRPTRPLSRPATFAGRPWAVPRRASVRPAVPDSPLLARGPTSVHFAASHLLDDGGKLGPAAVEQHDAHARRRPHHVDQVMRLGPRRAARGRAKSVRRQSSGRTWEGRGG